ncbi:MAG: hypothetical protein GY703_24735 [Gammaproteobacteria bacterium]|nr:hypothetical protein [Gammaproteobacteria bacterium]
MLIYLHGLNSSALSVKAGILRKQLAPVPVISPSYPAHRPDDAIATLSRFFANWEGREERVVLGSSMGGFYGQYLSRQFSMKHLFMINPALRPWDLLSEFEGQTMSTVEGVEYRVTRELIESTEKYGVERPCEGVPTTVFLDQEDEVIDYRIAESIYGGCGRVMVFKGGDHAFQHLEETLPVIQASLSAANGSGRSPAQDTP